MFPEVGHGRLDHAKTRAEIIEIVSNHTAIIVEDESGIVGSVGLQRYPVWYGDGEAIDQLWVFISPEHRNGRVLRLLLNECRDLADETGITVKLNIEDYSPGRRTLTLGRILQINPTPGSTENHVR
jgi:hypothetical protein